MEIVNKILKLSGILGILSVCCLGFSGVKYFNTKGSYISVNGLADRVIKSDEATIRIAFDVEGNKLSDMKANLSSTSTEVIGFLHKHGFTDEEIVSSSDEITDRLADRYARYSSQTAEKPENRYSVNRTIVVKTKKVDDAQQLSSQLVELYEKDICVSIVTKYSSSDFSKIRLDLLTEAVNDAKLRVKKIESASGIKTKGIKSVTTGRFVILNANSTGERDWSDGEDSYMKRYRIVVTVVLDKE